MVAYLGGKYRHAGAISRLILATDRDRYLEPFVGGGAVLERVAPHFADATAGDVSIDLILMWEALASGCWEPPTELSRERWEELRHSEPSAERGFAGFACSFSGKWFAGYAGGTSETSVVKTSRASQVANGAIRAIPHVAHVKFYLADYRTHEVGPDTVVYADPPYQDQEGYAAAGPFDSGEFWRVASGWGEAGAEVFVSESSAPAGWEEVYRKEIASFVGARHSVPRIERMFRYRGDGRG